MKKTAKINNIEVVFQAGGLRFFVNGEEKPPPSLKRFQMAFPSGVSPNDKTV